MNREDDGRVAPCGRNFDNRLADFAKIAANVLLPARCHQNQVRGAIDPLNVIGAGVLAEWERNEGSLTERSSASSGG